MATVNQETTQDIEGVSSLMVVTLLQSREESTQDTLHTLCCRHVETKRTYSKTFSSADIDGITRSVLVPAAFWKLFWKALVDETDKASLKATFCERKQSGDSSGSHSATASGFNGLNDSPPTKRRKLSWKEIRSEPREGDVLSLFLEYKPDEFVDFQFAFTLDEDVTTSPKFLQDKLSTMEETLKSLTEELEAMKARQDELKLLSEQANRGVPKPSLAVSGSTAGVLTSERVMMMPFAFEKEGDLNLMLTWKPVTKHFVKQTGLAVSDVPSVFKPASYNLICTRAGLYRLDLSLLSSNPAADERPKISVLINHSEVLQGAFVKSAATITGLLFLNRDDLLRIRVDTQPSELPNKFAMNRLLLTPCIWADQGNENVINLLDDADEEDEEESSPQKPDSVDISIVSSQTQTQVQQSSSSQPAAHHLAKPVQVPPAAPTQAKAAPQGQGQGQPKRPALQKDPQLQLHSQQTQKLRRPLETLDDNVIAARTLSCSVPASIDYQPGVFLSTPHVMVGAHPFCLKVYPRGHPRDKGSFLGLFLHLRTDLEPQTNVEVHAVMRFTVVNKDPSKSVERVEKHIFREDVPSWGFFQMIPSVDLRDPAKGFVDSEDRLLVRGEIAVVKGSSQQLWSDRKS